MRKSAQTEQDVLPIVGQCLEGIQRCTDSINEKEVRFCSEKQDDTSSPWLPLNDSEENSKCVCWQLTTEPGGPGHEF